MERRNYWRLISMSLLLFCVFMIGWVAHSEQAPAIAAQAGQTVSAVVDAASNTRTDDTCRSVKSVKVCVPERSPDGGRLANVTGDGWARYADGWYWTGHGWTQDR